MIPHPRSPSTKPELLAPGGSFLAAYHAFEAGADGVYLGMKEFSARKGAQNFSFDQLRRIRQLAADRDRRVYVTVNTVIREEELDRLSEMLAWLEALRVDAVIVQDLGVCAMVARHFPGITLHASTQMALHNEAGLRMAGALGIRRVILPRELPLARIRALHEAFPEMELEAFIHGALCYSFSGICLASSALTGRSSNRGDCAQICRSGFTEEVTAKRSAGSDPDAGCGHLFSCRDLFLGRNVRELAEAGVGAFKIEGRMKSPEYVSNVTRMYRAILDQGAGLPDPEYAELARRVELSFGRQPTTGWLRSSSGSRLIDTEFPGHRGTVLGTVSTVQGRELGLRVTADLSLRDGIGWFVPGEQAPTIISVTRIRRAGRDVRFARAGDSVTIELPADAQAAMPGLGAEIRHMSSRFLDLPQPRESGFSPYKVPVDVEVSLDRDGSLRFATVVGGTFDARVTLETAQKRRPFAEIVESLLRESGDSLFVAARLSFNNRTGLVDDLIFVPPSQLKKAKNDFYAALDAAFVAGTRARRGTGNRVGQAATAGGAPLRSDLVALADRRVLTPPGSAPVPFVDPDPSHLVVADLARTAGHVWLPLPPVIMEESAWPQALRRAAQEARSLGMSLAVGLNNLSHVWLARQPAAAGIRFFADVFLYVANTRAIELLRSLVPDLLFAYAWIEGTAVDAAALQAGLQEEPAVPVLDVSREFPPPLFYSMGCFARHVLNQGKCFEDCPKDFTRDLAQGKNHFRVVVRNCVTWLFKVEP